ncbi:MAG: glycosyltransferase [Archangium sp.]|nr:glycosyltransferase [Archangium sp.]
MTPAVSVVLPCRDAASTVERAVESLRAQTFTDFEVLAIDDRSTDGTGDVLRRLAEREPRIRVLETSADACGLVHALNLGLAHSRAPVLARMDADDESLPRRFEASVEALRDRRLTGVGTGVDICRDDRPPSPNLMRYGAWLSSLTTPEKLFNDRFVESPLCHPSVMLRTEALRSIGGWRDAGVPEDWELWLRLLESGHRLTCLPEVLHRWYDADVRLTRTHPRYRPEAHLTLKADTLAKRFEGTSVSLWGAGDIGVGLARALAARGISVTRLIDLNPRKIGQRIHGARVVLPEDLGPPGGEHLLSAVGAKGARAEIRAYLESRGWSEGLHFTCVA